MTVVPIATIPVLVCRPDRRILKDGTVRVRSADDIAYARDFASRFAGLMAWATDGMVRIETHEVDPGIPFDQRTEPAVLTTEFGESVHKGAVQTFRKVVDADAFGFAVFLGGPSLLNPSRGEYGLSWADNWIYFHAAAPRGYATTRQDRPHDGLIHEFAHQMQAEMQRKRVKGALNPDQAGRYGFREDERGWMNFLRAILTGIPGAVDGPGMTAERWKWVTSRKPARLPASVRLLPFVPIDPLGSYPPGSSAFASTTTPLRRPRTT